MGAIILAGLIIFVITWIWFGDLVMAIIIACVCSMLGAFYKLLFSK